MQDITAVGDVATQGTVNDANSMNPYRGVDGITCDSLSLDADPQFTDGTTTTIGLTTFQRDGVAIADTSPLINGAAHTYYCDVEDAAFGFMAAAATGEDFFGDPRPAGSPVLADIGADEVGAP
jgi:hypothetical protein